MYVDNMRVAKILMFPNCHISNIIYVQILTADHECIIYM